MSLSNAPKEALVEIYRRAAQIRAAETTLKELFAEGKMPGFVHLSLGQEAIAAGLSQHLTKGDTVASNHRGHGHTLAKGVDLTGFFAEILGRATGICGGRGGSMHVADLTLGMLGANGIVGAGLPLTTGSALALKMRGQGEIAVVYFGDGALAEGLVHECFNIAKLWSLPVLFCCENNGWSEFSPSHRQIAFTLERLSAAYDIPYRSLDGNDIREVYEGTGEVIAQMRGAPQPFVIECHTTRVQGHYEGDKQDYRPDGELAALAARDPMVIGRQRLLEAGVTEAEISQIAAEVAAANTAALEAALAAPLPEVATLLNDVYTPEANHG